MGLYHRAGTSMVTPDYVSCCGANLCFNELTREYVNKTVNFCKLYPPATGTMLLENMPGYGAPRVRSSMPPEPSPPAALHFAPTATTYVDPAFASILSSVYTENSVGHHFCLQTVPILTGYLTPEESDRISHQSLTKCDRLHDNLTYAPAHLANFLLLDCGIPTRTSIVFFTAISHFHNSIRTENFKIHDPRLIHVPTAIIMVPAFMNGTIALESQITKYGITPLRTTR